MSTLLGTNPAVYPTLTRSGRPCSIGGMCGAIVTAPLDVVKTRLQSNLFQKQAAAEGTVLHRHGVRGLLWNFVDTGKIIRSVGSFSRSESCTAALDRAAFAGPATVSELTEHPQPTATSTCTKALARSSKVSVRLWQAQYPHGSLSLDHLRSRQSKLTLILVPRSINFFVYGNGKHLYAEWFNGGKENSAIHLMAAATAGKSHLESLDLTPQTI